MSFEGYHQVICKNGHYHTSDDVYSSDPEMSCPICKAGPQWWHVVDQTNGSHDEFNNRIDGYVELEVDKPAKTETCPCCGHVKTLERETYKVPKDIGNVVT